MDIITVKCYRGSGDKVADDIVDSLINTQAHAVARGKKFLDKPENGGYYITYTHNFVLPYKGPLSPGDWIDITSSKYGYTAKKVRVKNVKVFSVKPGVLRHNVVGQVFST